jgi:LysM repeat protein
MKKILVSAAAIVLVQLMFVSLAYAAPPVKDGEIENIVQSGDTAYHTVKHGETLYSIAQFYGISSQTIAQANGLQNPDEIDIGQNLLVPQGPADGYYQPVVQPNDAPQYTVQPGDPVPYIVQIGDTLFSIGQRYGVSAQVIAQVNGVQNPDSIYATQRLFIPQAGGNGGDDYDVSSETEDTEPQQNGGFSQIRFPPEIPVEGGAFDAVDALLVITPASPAGGNRYAGYGLRNPGPYVIRLSISALDPGNANGIPQGRVSYRY